MEEIWIIFMVQIMQIGLQLLQIFRYSSCNRTEETQISQSGSVFTVKKTGLDMVGDGEYIISNKKQKNKNAIV